MKKVLVSNFIKNIIALMTSQVVVKILGMVYSLYLINKRGFGDKGNAIYTSAYQIYAIFLSICSIGIPNAVSKIISENLAVGDVKGAKKVFKISIFIFSFLGFIFSIFLYFFADFIGNKILQTEASSDILKILAPSIFFVSICVVIRGYFIGKQNAKVSAEGQIFEQFIKTFLTISLIEFISVKTNYNTEIMAKFAMIAVSISSIISAFHLAIKYILEERKNKTDEFLGNNRISKNARKILNEILKLAIPVSIASFVMILGKNIDSITIIRLLKNKIGENLAKEKYGILSSKVELLTAFPASLNGVIAVSLIPEISRLNALGENELLNRKINFSFLLTIFTSIPIMFGMMAFSKEIMNLLFPNANKGASLLKIAAISIIFKTLTQTAVGILQGVGETNSYLKIISFSIIIKLILNIILIPMDIFLEKGALISTIIYDIIVFVLIFYKINKTLNLKLSIYLDFVKVSTLAIVSIIISKLITKNLYEGNLKSIIEISLVGIIYLIFFGIIYGKKVKVNVNLNKRNVI